MDKELTIAIPLTGEWLEDRYKNYFCALCDMDASGVLMRARIDPEEFDGLILPGGADINPARYGQANAGSQGVENELDALQFEALEAFVRAGKPVLGICRGHQLINVYFGGTLIQHLPQSPAHSKASVHDPDKAHLVTAEAGSLFADLYGERFPVNSAHHQGVDRLGEGLRITLRSDDGVVEGMEHETLPLFSVQWHPERMCFDHARPDTVDGSVVLARFLELCRERRG